MSPVFRRSLTFTASMETAVTYSLLIESLHNSNSPQRWNNTNLGYNTSIMNSVKQMSQKSLSADVLEIMTSEIYTNYCTGALIITVRKQTTLFCNNKKVADHNMLTLCSVLTDITYTQTELKVETWLTICGRAVQKWWTMAIMVNSQYLTEARQSADQTVCMWQIMT